MGSKVFSAVLVGVLVLLGCATPGNVDYRRLSFSPGTPVVQQVNNQIKDEAQWFSPIVSRAGTVLREYDDTGRGAVGPYLEADIYLYDDEELDNYLNTILQHLSKALDFELPTIDIIVESNPRFSAYIDELFQIHLSTGLLRSLSNEDQVAGVIAHELGHLVLRHNLEKKSTSNISGAIEFASSMTSQLSGSRLARQALDINRDNTRSAVDSLDTLALLWTDLLEPSWSRSNEREADFFAMDLMKVAGYNHEQLITAIEKIHDANAVRSDRLNRLNRISDELIVQQQKSAVDDKQAYQQFIGDASARLVSALTDQGLSFLAEKGQSHDNRNERIANLKNYINETYDLYTLPPDVREADFDRIVKGGSSAENLRSDLAAVETLIAISKRNMAVARDRMAVINTNPDGASQMAASMAQTSIYVANRNFDSALNKLVVLSNNPNAPAEVFIKLAKLHSSKRDYIKAEQALLEGASRIGRRYRFLPTLIKLYRVQSNTDAAERATLECGQYDNDKALQFVSFVSEITLDTADSYYRYCADILGYDVRAKRNKARRQQLEDLHNQGIQILDRWLE